MIANYAVHLLFSDVKNLTEFSNEIDRRVVQSIDFTLSSFRADKISPSYIKFIQNLLKADDKTSRCHM